MVKNAKSLATGNEPETARFPRRRTMAAKNTEEPMLLYLDKKRAPNPCKLRIFLAEKGLDIPTKELDLYVSEQKPPEFRALNPFAGVPIVVLGDGTVLIESLPIMEDIYPEPQMISADPVPRALVRSWKRHC